MDYKYEGGHVINSALLTVGTGAEGVKEKYTEVLVEVLRYR